MSQLPPPSFPPPTPASALAPPAGAPPPPSPPPAASPSASPAVSISAGPPPVPADSTAVAAGPTDPKRSRHAAALLLAAVAGAAVAGGAILVVSNRADESVTTNDAPVAIEAPTEEAAAPPIPASTVPAAPAPESTAPMTAPATTASATTVPATTVPATTVPATTAPATTVPATTVPATTAPVTTAVAAPGIGEDVPESKAVVRDGQIYLEGAVPTMEAGEEIAALAAEILGPDNVFNEYVVDPRAGDPNLGNITVEDTINFATGSSVILPGSETLLNQGLALFTIRPSMTLVVVGHTDDRGSEEYNQELSQARAEAIVQWYSDRDVDSERITARGAGESEPLTSNDTAEGRGQNRRIQFFLENILG